ncbi:hypothetical protein J7K74_03265 [Candidatus Woesearchaeota archaeon]|nr:hypothetical protein [Candidatus Woesearchaeota archaeon]
MVSIKNTILGVLIVGLFLFTSCAQQQTTTTGKTFIGGTQGLAVEFLQGAPPDNILSGGQLPFSILVKIENKGEYPASGYIKLGGIDPSSLGLEEKDLEIQFNALKEVKLSSTGAIMPGGITQIGWQGLTYNQAIPSGTMNVPITVTSCYDYGTRAIVLACISDDPYDTSNTASCKVNEEKQVSSSGAPVQVVSAQEMAGGMQNDQYTYFLTFEIRNMGMGTVFDKNIKECDTTTKGLKDMNKVKVIVQPLSKGVEVKCFNEDNPGESSNGIVILTQGQEGGESATVMCQLTAKPSGSYQVPVEITLEYKYSEQITKNVLIGANPTTS